jgi:hypothetical protein
MVEELLTARRAIVSHETVGRWAGKFGQPSANRIRRRLPRADDKWHGRGASPCDGLVAMCDGGGVLSLPPGDPAEDLVGVRNRLMLDVSYAGSSLVGQAGGAMAG